MLKTKGVRAESTYSPRAYTHKWLPPVTPDRFSSSSEVGKEPLKINFFTTPDFSGSIIDTQYRSNSYIDLFDSAPPFFYSDTNPHSLVVISFLIPSKTGTYSFEVASVGNARLYINDVLLIDKHNWTSTGEIFYSFRSIAKRASLHMLADQTYTVRLEASTKLMPKGSTTDDDPVHVFGSTQRPPRLHGRSRLPLDDIVLAAEDVDIVICVLGLNSQWESEGYDRQSMLLPRLTRLPPHERKLQAREDYFVNQSGSPVHMPWAGEASTIM